MSCGLRHGQNSDPRPHSWSSAVSCQHSVELVRMWLSSAFSRYPIHPNRHSSFLFVILPSPFGQNPLISLSFLPAKGRMLNPIPCHSVGKGTFGTLWGSMCLAQGAHRAVHRCSVPEAAGAWLLVAHVWASAMQQQRAVGHCWGTSRAGQPLCV